MVRWSILLVSLILLTSCSLCWMRATVIVQNRGLFTMEVTVVSNDSETKDIRVGTAEGFEVVEEGVIHIFDSVSFSIDARYVDNSLCDGGEFHHHSSLSDGGEFHVDEGDTTRITITDISGWLFIGDPGCDDTN